MNEEIAPLPLIPDGLREAAQLGRLVPFIGAGVSRIAGCPGWSELADGALQVFIEQGKFTYGQLEQIKHLGARVKLSIALGLQDEHKLEIDFKKLLYPSGGSTNQDSKGRRLYGSLASLGHTFVTTNYDEWLDEQITTPTLAEATMSQQQHSSRGSARTVIYKVDEILPSVLNQSNTVIHLHGSLRDPKQMILTTRDYIRHYANDRSDNPEAENRVLTFLKHLFETRNVLFVGYGLEELEILEYIILKARSDKPEVRHYLLQPYFSHEGELVRSLRRYYRECGIELIPYLRDNKNWDQLLEVLEDFARKAPASAPLVLEEFQEMERLLR